MSYHIYLKNFKALVSYATSNGINLVLPFLLLPVFTSLLSKSDYGVIANFLIIFQISAILISFGSNAAVSRAFWDKESINFRDYVSTSLIFNFFIFSLLISLALVLHFFFYFELISFLVIIFCSGLVVTLKDYKFKLWNLEKKPFKYSVFNATFSISNYLLALFFVFSFLPDWRSRVYGVFITQIVFCLISLLFLMRENKLSFAFNFKYMKDIFSYGYPLFFHGLGVVLLSSADKIILTSLVDLSSTGLLAVAAVVASLMSIPILTFDLFVNPIINEILKESSKKSMRRFSRYLLLNIFILGISGFLLYLLTPFIFSLFIDEQFYQSEFLVGYLIIGQFFYGLYRFFSRPIFFSKKTYLVTFCTFLSGIIGLAAQFFLIGSFGLVGACIGNAFGYFLSFLFSLIISKRLYDFRIISN